MSLAPMRQIRTSEKPLMDLQTNVGAVVLQAQQQALAEARFITITLPTVAAAPLANANNPTGDINLTHNFGRPSKGYFIGYVPLATWLGITGPNLFLMASPTANPSPNVFTIIRCSMQSPAVGPALTLGVIVF